jgi:putative oxidoreductase
VNDEFFAKWAPRMLGVLRIVVALTFMEHGMQKLFGFPPSARGGTVDLLSLAGLAGTLETFGGLAMLLGAFTRPVAFVLAGEMAFAYFMSHAPRGFFPVNNGGDAAILYCFVFLYFAVAGSGAFAIDWLRAGRSSLGQPAHGRA